MSARAFVLPVVLWKHPKDEKPRSIAIVNRGTLFKSTLAPAYEGKLKLFGGLVEKGETPEQALERELGEELPSFFEHYKFITRGLRTSWSEHLCSVSDKPFSVFIRHWYSREYVYSTKEMYRLIDKVGEGNAEFYDILNRPFDSEEWVPFLSVLQPAFLSYRLEHS